MDKSNSFGSLTALAQGSCLDVFPVPVQAGSEGVPAGAIGAALEFPSATLSFHLKALKSSGLIRCKRQGTSRIDRPDCSAVNELGELFKKRRQLRRGRVRSRDEEYFGAIPA